MKVYSIFVHPNAQSLTARLFNIANKHFVSKGYEVETLDLFQVHDALQESVEILYSNPVPDPVKKYRSSYHHNYTKIISEFSAREIEKLKHADILYIQTPILVWMVPAILKLYIESVIVPEGTFVPHDIWSEDFHIDKLLEGKKIFVSLVMGTGIPCCNYVMGSVDNMLNPIKSVFDFVGYKWMDPHITWGTSQTIDKRQDYLDAFQQHLDKLF
jgi:putative NADPH-quinone reductase